MFKTAEDFRSKNIDPDGVVYFSCIGRWVPGIGCDWTLGGLLRIHTLEVINGQGDKIPVFEFADDPDAPEPANKKSCPVAPDRNVKTG